MLYTVHSFIYADISSVGISKQRHDVIDMELRSL